jgi:hypothetical protein
LGPGGHQTVFQLLQSYGKIADMLNKTEVPTALGKKWHSSTIKYVVTTYKRLGPGEQSA